MPKYYPESVKEGALKYVYMDEKELLKDFATVLPPEEIERIREVSRELEPMEQDIVKLEQVDRLRLLWQTSGVMDTNFLTEDFQFDPRADNDGRSTPAFSHNRYQHSKLIGFYHKAVLARLGADISTIKNAVATGWFHDSGHSALAHTGDDFMVKLGMPDHEQRAIERLREPETQALLTKHQLDESEIVATIEERSKIGHLQKVLDTLSYTTIDTAMYGDPKYPDSGAGMIADIEGIDPETGNLIVKNPELWQDLLETRAKMMQRYYRSEEDVLADNAKLQAVRLASTGEKWGHHNEHTMKPEDVGTYNDLGLWLNLRDFQYQPPSSVDKPSVDKLLQLATGDRSSWEIKKFDTREEALAEQQSAPEQLRDYSFIVDPYTDYTKKTLDVYTRGAEGLVRHTLQAKDTEFTEDDQKYIVAILKLEAA